MTADVDGLGADLGREFGDRLLRVRTPIDPCLADPGSQACVEALQNLQNPFSIEDEPGAFHTTGWLGAYDAGPSPYAIAVETVEDIAAAVAFARNRGLRLAIKGAGHDYLGRSSAPEALQLWTRRMAEITVHDDFTPMGASRDDERGIPAITVGAGTRWLEAYQALAVSGRYVQGGGCTTVGAAGGFTQGGGFGSFSRCFGTAAGNVLEVEVVVASGEVLVANATRNADLYWAVRGGGGGTFGVVSKMTLRTHPMPATLGAVAGTIRAGNDEDFRRLVAQLVRVFPKLCDDHWGEQVRLNEDNSVEFSMTAVDLDGDEAQAVWAPLLAWVDGRSDAFTSDAFVATVPFDRFWDPGLWDELAPDMIRRDLRSGQPSNRFWWATNQGEVSQYLNAYQSRWIPRQLCDEAPGVLAEALFKASRQWHVSLPFNKALSGASPEADRRDKTTSINPTVFDAACLLICASNQQPVFPGVPGFEPDVEQGARYAQRVRRAMDIVRAVTPDAGSYVNETDYFEPDWQQSLWGSNYPRLLEIKRRYDPDNLFRVHHGVGSEETSRLSLRWTRQCSRASDRQETMTEGSNRPVEGP